MSWSSCSLKEAERLCWEGKRGTLKEAAGAAVCGMDAEADRTPPVRRPERREARGFGGAVVMAGDR